MKGIKKLLTGILAATMIMGSALSVSATDTTTSTETSSITVENAIAEKTYQVWRILDFEVSSGSGSDTTGIYKINSSFADFIKAQTTYFTIDANGYVTATDALTNASADTLQTLAQAALTYAQEKSITANGTAPANSDGTASFSNLELGYYVMDSSTGALCSLQTNTGVTIQEKNGVPTVEKTVEEEGTYDSNSDAMIGDTVNYQTVITLQAGAQDYVLHDSMTDGLTYNGDVAIEGLTAGTDYTVATGSADGCDFEIVFAESYLNTITAETQITVTYSATINDAAVINGANQNETYLEYGDGNTTETSTTNTYTYSFEIYKNNGTDRLADAHFTLYTDSALTSAVSLYMVSDTEYRVATADEITAGTNITTDIVTVTDDNIIVEGLDATTYYLKETAAPSGYTQLTSAVTVQILRGATWGTYSVNGAAKATPTVVDILNSTGSLLPSTGGIGTTIFYIVGGLLILAAVAYFIFKRKAASLN
jgi:fimbrial isopeptide formation D2 family protein/LPXTG-motif cell wall-anchored protein